MNSPSIEGIGDYLTGAVCLSIAAFVLKDADLSCVTSMGFASLLIGLNCLPFLLLHRWLGSEYGFWQAVVLLADVLLIGWTAHKYVNAFYLHPDPQSGALLLFSPFYSMAFVAALFILRQFLRLFKLG